MAFIDINHQLIANIYADSRHYKTWRGFRLCAIDGTSIRLPNEPDITNHFGFQKGKESQADCSIGMASVFYDVLNHMVLDSCVKPNGTAEKYCAAEHLKHADKNDLIIYDRGYNAFWFYAHHIQHNQPFCMRAKANQNLTIKANQNLTIKAFIESGKKEAVVTFKPNKPSMRTCIDRGLLTTPVSLRLVRVDLPNEVEVLITNLMDTKKYDAGLFKSLYHLRWGIEENYKRLKQWVEIENFSGKSTLSVKQDFYAKIVAANLTALLAMVAQQAVDTKPQHLKVKYQINFAQALSKMKHRIVCSLLAQIGDSFLARVFFVY